MTENSESKNINEPPKPLFRELVVEDDEPEVTEIESLCVNCENNGITRLMLTKIPHFREIVISSFDCPHCGNANREVQSAGIVGEKGVKFELTVKEKEDLNRQVIKSEYGSFAIPDLEFEDVVGKKRGEINTLEGFMNAIISNLEILQDERKLETPEIAEKISEFIEKLEKLTEVEKPFTFVLNDPSGNSFIENPYAPQVDKNLKIIHYSRSARDNELLGFSSEEKEPETDENLKDEVLHFQTNCSRCGSPAESKMKMLDIPMFKEVIIMAISCDMCGYKDSEVKSGKGIEDKGKKITLKITDPSDMSRDILKSNTCSLKIPELEFELVAGTLGGKFTTIEGLLLDIITQLSTSNPFLIGDSVEDNMNTKLKEFCTKLKNIADGELNNVHIELDDPAGNSYLQNVYAPEVDPEMKIEVYERTHEQDVFLGIDGLKMSPAS
ncbi:DgyrCDS7621 [Dimorphilus gyrociliatus]|uniref:DgyrCDS7621 n=1 Tax=Dimorphilus gyrociliatus TaxID=2664684 RepID=A0A7I8VT98_9ANNE|nr:DgyrCDS7621 [Dimorphilus gyrociliatus]